MKIIVQETDFDFAYETRHRGIIRRYKEHPEALEVLFRRVLLMAEGMLLAPELGEKLDVLLQKCMEDQFQVIKEDQKRQVGGRRF